MMTLRIARRANSEVCWSVSVAVERYILAKASSASCATIATFNPAVSTTNSVTATTTTQSENKKQHSRQLSDAARARIELSPSPTPSSNSSAATLRTSSTSSTSGSNNHLNIPTIQDVGINIPAGNNTTTLNITSKSVTHEKVKKMKEEPKTKFKFEDYDCIGFDLDNTICRYKVSNMVKLEYKALSEYLINKCHYNPKYLSLPIELGVEFMLKGLILDVKKGNILRIAPDGKILHGSHGSKELSKADLVNYYGENIKWEVTDLFIKDPLHTWNGPLSETMRTLSDYFDMPASLVFARAVDTLDEENNNQPLDEYHIYPHIQEALQDMFQKEHFEMSKGGYFPNIKSNPDNYIHTCSPQMINWFKDLRKQNKKLFLITGSNVDFASHTASKSLGPDWQDLFDIVICFAKKPGFFTQKRPFKALDGFVETCEVSEDDLQHGKIYTSGNWEGVYKFLKNTSGKDKPRVVYIGDHLIQDVYTPSAHTEIDAVAVCEELEAEGVYGHEKSHHDDDFLLSARWGSYFHHQDEENIWMDFLRKHAKLVVPSLEYVAKHPINHEFDSLQ